tara:strand:- start:353 stop:961 length:609 start_codon:yes stop_codon:yes gene_type:complete
MKHTDNSIIFIHIPKTAGFTIGKCLRKNGSLKNGYGFSHKIARNIIKPEHKNCIVMCVVRNPYDRLYSIYEFYRKKRNDINVDVTFEDFILNFEKDYYLKKPQFDTCYNFISDKTGKIMATDIIKFENLNLEYDNFCKKYNIVNNLIKDNVNELKNNNICFDTLYSTEMQTIVNKIFQKDFEFFDYNYSQFINSKIQKFKNK